MRSEIAALSANLAGVVRGSIVCDPCCGSGALLCACIAAGAIAALGSDMQPPECHHRDIRLRTDSFHDRLVADAALLSLRPYSLDAIITDPPYGRRATAHGSSAQNVEATWQSIVVALARVASDALVVGGKLLCWVPHDGYTEAWLREVLSPQCPVLRMTCYLPERRDAGLLRAVAVWKKCSMNDDGKAPFLVAKHMRGKSATACAKGVQREHTPDAAWSKQEQPVDRSQPYRQARAAANGARADIWRCVL